MGRPQGRKGRRQARTRSRARSGLRWRWVLAFGILVTGAAAAALWHRSQEDSNRVHSDGAGLTGLHPRGDGFNVLLISMDTVRADHLACYGHPTIKTPHLDRLAAEGTLFAQCMSAVPATLPSHASMMTGTYPFVHGVRGNSQFHLHDDNDTLAERLRSAGYATGAEVAAFVLNAEFGMDQGFDVYRDIYSAWQVEGGLSRETYSERKAAEVCDGALGWLRQQANRKFFLFVHFFDPHQPHEPPRRFASQYRNRYLGEIAYVDEQVGRLMTELTSLGVDDRTLVILTADHGEGFGQHDEDTHMTFVYDTTMSVPLIIRCPARIPAGRRVRAQVRTIDIAPTVLAFLGIDPMPNAQGRSLLPLAADPTADPGWSAYGESLNPLHNYGYAALRAIRRDGWKFIHAPRPELYNVREDPGELRNLALLYPQRVERMREILYRLVLDAPAVVGAASAQRAMSTSDIERLQALGYVGGSSTAEDFAKSELELLDFDPSDPDPKDHIEEIKLTIRAVGLKHSDQPEEAEQALRELFARSPESSRSSWWAQRNLGLVLADQGKKQEAIEAYRNALRIRALDGTTRTDLGLALATLGRIDEALVELRKALEIPPVLARTHRGCAKALWQKGEREAAIRQFRLAVEKDPSHDRFSMVDRLAWILATCPDDALRDGAEAVRLAEMACDATKRQDASLLDTLAAAYAEQGRFDDAVAVADQALQLAEKGDDRQLTAGVRRRRRLYAAQQPFRDR